MAFVQGDIPVNFQNVGFNSPKIRALSGVYTDMYIWYNGAVSLLHCFMSFYLRDCRLTVECTSVTFVK